MRPFLWIALLASCTSGPVGGDDTGDGTDDTADTGDTFDTDVVSLTEVFGMRGTATVDPVDGTWIGTTTVYEELVQDGVVTQIMCTLDFASSGQPANPSAPCADCAFTFAVAHSGEAVRTGSMCDTLWPRGHTVANPASWDAVLGFDPSGWNDEPSLMVWVSAWTDDEGTFHEAGWQGVPRADHPSGGASFDDATGAFAFDHPIETWGYGAD